VGATGATGADGGIDAKDADWLNLTLAKSVTVPNKPDAIFPACFPDINGQLYLRGHVTLSPVPAVGGGMLAILPKNSKGDCACTPLPDPNTMDNNVIATTTALAYPRDTPNKPDVCIVRLLISMFMPVDVNLDLVVNQTDFNLVEDSPYYNFNLNASSTCPQAQDGTRVCGRADVNGDGFVNQLDQTSIAQSADYKAGTRIPCGGVYATAFSCGSTRSSPLVPAVDISLDSIVYFNNDGVFGAETPLSKRSADASATQSILVDFEHLHGELLDTRSDVTRQLATVSTKVATVDTEVTAVRAEVEHVDSKVAAVDSKFDTELSTVRSEVRKVESKFGAKFDQHEQALRRSQPVTQREMLMGASVAGGVVIMSGVLVYFMAKRR